MPMIEHNLIHGVFSVMKNIIAHTNTAPDNIHVEVHGITLSITEAKRLYKHPKAK